MGRTAMPFGMPPCGNGDAKTPEELSGTYHDPECDQYCGKCCTTKICFMGPMMCVGFYAGPVPFSATYNCPAGTNCWTNYQGYGVSVKDGKVYGSYFCCIAELEKDAAPAGAAPT